MHEIVLRIAIHQFAEGQNTVLRPFHTPDRLFFRPATHFHNEVRNPSVSLPTATAKNDMGRRAYALAERVTSHESIARERWGMGNSSCSRWAMKTPLVSPSFQLFFSK